MRMKARRNRFRTMTCVIPCAKMPQKDVPVMARRVITSLSARQHLRKTCKTRPRKTKVGGRSGSCGDLWRPWDAGERLNDVCI